MKMLTSLLDKLYKAQARMFKPVAEKDLRALRIAMAKEKMPPLPTDYLQFLSLTDGLMYNGLRFFGATDHDRGLLAYTYPTLFKVNQGFRQLKRRQDVLILGENDEDWLVYSPKMKTYQLMDKMDLIGDLTLPRFFDLIYFFSQELLNEENPKD